jgi:hypothetical protein
LLFESRPVFRPACRSTFHGLHPIPDWFRRRPCRTTLPTSTNIGRLARFRPTRRQQIRCKTAGNNGCIDPFHGLRDHTVPFDVQGDNP